MGGVKYLTYLSVHNLWMARKVAAFFLHLHVDSTYEDQEAIGTVLNADNRNASASSKGKWFNKKFYLETRSHQWTYWPLKLLNNKMTKMQ